MRKTRTARIDLPDINVWLALVDRHHPHHERARHYWDGEAADELAFCRITMLGLLRLGSNRSAMHGNAFTPREIWAAYRTFRGLPEVTFISEPEGLEAQMTGWSDTDTFPVRSWTDCYLASLASLSRCRLVSFDRDFNRFHGLDFHHLTL